MKVILSKQDHIKLHSSYPDYKLHKFNERLLKDRNYSAFLKALFNGFRLELDDIIITFQLKSKNYLNAN